MESIKLNYSNVLQCMSEDDIKLLKIKIDENHTKLHEKTGVGSEFTDWIELPTNYDKEEYDNIKKASKYIQENADALIVIGIGGSYLGARAVIQMLTPTYSQTKTNTAIYFAGNDISSKHLSDLIKEIDGKDFCINVISKSGTTTEPAIAFRIFKDILEEKYGKEEAKNRIFVTTDKQKGALKPLANENGYETFVVPDGIGGRYSVLTAVGLLPIAVSGVDVDELMDGAKDMQEICNNVDNIAYTYAAIRNVLYSKGKKIEILANFEPSSHYFTEWWKQLYGESEGKENKGIFPTGVDNTTDLHSMGQYIQDGERQLFETFLHIEGNLTNLELARKDDNVGDGLKYLEGTQIDYINQKALEATMLAHRDGGVPNIRIDIPELREYYVGQLIYFFEMACAMSGYILGVNPFNQPGVEAYKKNMFRLLGKEGY